MTKFIDIKPTKKELVTYGLAASLLLNVTFCVSSITDTKKHDQQIKDLESTIRIQDDDKEFLLSRIDEEMDSNDELQHKFDDLLGELDMVKQENEQLKKMELERKEVENKQRKLNMTLTFYGADCYKCSGTTRTGIDVKNTIYYQGMRVVAADPRVIKLHSIIKIETDKESYMAYVSDTGGKIKGNILDVLVKSEKESYKYGRQKATVIVLREGKG